MIKFDPPIVPREVHRFSWQTAPSKVDPPLDVDELPGILTAWKKRADGWWGMVEHRYPFHGFGTMLQIIEWYPAERLRRSDTQAELPKRR